MRLIEFIKERFKKELTKKEKLEKAYELVRRNIVVFAETRDLLAKADKPDLTKLITWMKKEKKKLKKMIKECEE